jgi:hypothetical protein
MQSKGAQNCSFYTMSLAHRYTGRCWTSGSCDAALKSSTSLRHKIYYQKCHLLDGRWFWHAGNTPSEILTDYSDKTGSLFARVSALPMCRKWPPGAKDECRYHGSVTSWSRYVEIVAGQVPVLVRGTVRTNWLDSFCLHDSRLGNLISVLPNSSSIRYLTAASSDAS